MIAHCNNFPRRKTTTTGPTLWSRCGWWGTSCATPLTSCTASTSPTLTSSQRTSSSWTLTTIQFTTPKRWVSLYTKPIVWLLIDVKMKLLFKCSYVGWWCLLCKIISPIIFSAMLFFFVAVRYFGWTCTIFSIFPHLLKSYSYVFHPLNLECNSKLLVIAELY